MQSIQDFEDDNYKGNYHSLNEKDNQQQQYNERMKNPNEIKLVNSSSSPSSNNSSLQNDNNYNNNDSVTKTEILLQNDNVVIIAPKKEENSHDNSYNNNYNNNNNCNDNQSKNRNDNNEKIKYFTFWMIAISVHLIMSMNQVFSRFLQHEGSLNQQTPILSLIIISNLIAFILYIPKILFNFIKFYFKNYKNVKNLKNTNGFTTTNSFKNNFTNLKNNFKNLFLSKNIKFYTFICIYLFTTVIGSSLLEFSVKYTQAIYVQLIMLSIPFLVYFSNICFLKTEKFSFIDFIIGFFIIIGTALVIISSSTATANDTANDTANRNDGTGNEYHWKWIPDFTKIGYSFNIPNDPIGITLACIACLFFSMMGCVNIISPKLTKNYTTTAQTTTTTVNNNDNNDTVNKNDNVILVEKQNEKEEELMIEREFNENNNCHEELFELKQQQLKQQLEKEEHKEENVVHYSTLNNDLNQPLLSDDNNNEEDHLVNCHNNNSEEEPLIKLTEDYGEEEEKYNNMESLQKEQEEEQKSISPENLFILQKILLFTWPIIPSIILKEDWSIYLNLSLEKWLILISFSILSKGYASLFEVWSSKEIGSGNYTMMLPLRIVLGFILAGVMLREWIDNLFAVLGCVIVVVSIIIFTVRKQHVQNEASGIKNK